MADANAQVDLGGGPGISVFLSFTAGKHIAKRHVVPNPSYATVAPIDASTYAERIDTLFDRYPMETHLANLNLLESHDTARFLTTAS